ncbi:recombinase family protein [Nocardia sp. CC227C]|uniref:recombinase family protein n=1 Tax=Nocardia sp. CC227C TaxID=3044562 RepID=UPI00278BD03B|nr:recombinase family protein [Nocardia sp. CC227C]
MTDPLADDFVPAVLFLSTAAGRQGVWQYGEPIRIQVQRDAGHRLAVERGFGIVQEFVEIGVPAISLRRRPALRRLLAYLARHPNIRAVIFPGRHRFARDLAAAERLHNRFRRLNVALILASGEPITSIGHQGITAPTRGGSAV